MKKNFLWAMSSCALLFTTAFTSCDEEEDSNPVSSYPEKVLVSFKASSSVSLSEMSLTYDNNGRVIKSTNDGAAMCTPSKDTSSFSFDNKTFTGKTNGSSFPSKTFTEISGELNQQGCIVKCSKETKYETGLETVPDFTKISTSEYKYNEFGQLTFMSYTLDTIKIEDTFKWEDGNVVGYGDGSTTYSFNKDSRYKNRGKIRFADCIAGYPNAAYGVANEYLPISITYNNSDGSKESYDFEYTFDEDGYPLTIKWADVYRELVWKNK